MLARILFDLSHDSLVGKGNCLTEVISLEDTILWHLVGTRAQVGLLPVIYRDTVALDILPAQTFVEGEDTAALQDVLQEDLST